MGIIEITNLKKSFGKHQALKGVDMNVEEGQVYGFIGPNGAGKSTTIRILLGMLKKDAGEIRLFGRDPWKDAVELHRRIAYVPGDVTLWPNLTGGEAIDFLGRLNGGFDKKIKDELIEKFQLEPRKKCKAYSKGNRQKVALIAALASGAELLILDEPTSGLDPLMELVFQEYIKKAKKEGKTILLSSHILAEVEAVCDQVGIIRQGEIVEAGSLKDLRHLTGTRVTVELNNLEFDLKNLDHIYDAEREGSRWKFTVAPSSTEYVMNHLAAAGIQSITAAPPTLEELFIRHYDKNIKERG